MAESSNHSSGWSVICRHYIISRILRDLGSSVTFFCSNIFSTFELKIDPKDPVSTTVLTVGFYVGKYFLLLVW